ncbi:MAG: hypothetical protein ACP5K7_13815 [Verrucomicrobiia bacterium]|jgi:hypothetical protein
MTFKSDVYNYFGRYKDDYYKTVFYHCLYPHAVLPAKILMKIRPSLFIDDFELLRMVANATHPDEIIDIVTNFNYENPPRGILRGLFRIRISPERLIRFATKIMKPRLVL